MLVNRNTNTVDTGNYTIQGSKDTLTVTDKTTGESFKVWGDPHIETSDGDKTDFMQKPATFMLPDGTKVTVTPTKSDNPNAATYIDNVTITRGDDAVQMTGVHDGKLHTDVQRGEGQWLDERTPDGTVLTAKDGHIKDLMVGTAEIKGDNIKNIDLLGDQPVFKPAPYPVPKPLPSPMPKPPVDMRPPVQPPVLRPGWGPHPMGPFGSNISPRMGIAIAHQIGRFIAGMFPPPMPGGKPGIGTILPAKQEPMKVDSNTNTVDTGNYTIQASKDSGGTLLVTDKTTGENFRIWSDPYIGTSDGDRTQFNNQPATFILPDNTKVTVNPTKGGGTTYIDNVTITRGDDAVQIGGVHAGDIHTQALRGEGQWLDARYDDGVVLTAKDGHIKDLMVGDTEIKGYNVSSIDQFANKPKA